MRGGSPSRKRTGGGWPPIAAELALIWTHTICLRFPQVCAVHQGFGKRKTFERQGLCTDDGAGGGVAAPRAPHAPWHTGGPPETRVVGSGCSLSRPLPLGSEKAVFDG